MFLHGDYDKMSTKAHKLPQALRDFGDACGQQLDTLPNIFRKASFCNKTEGLLGARFMMGMQIATGAHMPATTSSLELYKQPEPVPAPAPGLSL